MSTPNQKGLNYGYIPTENPEEWILAEFRSRDWVTFEKLPKIGMKYREWAGRDEGRVKLHGDWVYLTSKDRQTAGDGSIGMSFSWGRPWSVDEIARPVPFRSWISNEKGVDWPPVLEPLPNGEIIHFDESDDFPYSKTIDYSSKLVSTPRALVRFSMRAAWTKSTAVRTDLYLSPVKWGPRALEVIEPMEQRVRWNHLTTSEDLGECLHDTIYIPALGEVSAYVSTGGGTYSTAAPPTTAEVLPATNFTSWEDHRIAASQEYVEGLWLITIKTALCPEKLPLTIETRETR